MTNEARATRRALLQAALAAPVLAACGGVSTSGTGGAGSVNFLSTQFTPVEERQRFEKILADKVTSAKVGYNPVDNATFATTLRTQVEAGKVQVNLVGGLHGDLAPLGDKLMDLDDLAGSLTDRGFAADLIELGKLGGTTAKYIPWMQATYMMAVNKKALQWLPSGADVQKLTYDQFLSWMTAAKAGNGGKPVFGLGAGPKGLYHRFFQGFLLPSFTGGQITTFRSADAVTAWEYMKELWAQTAPASTNYDFVQEPLQRGEVLVGFDHVARLATAPKDKPDEWLMVPAPSGPKGLGYMLVIAGLGIPKGAPDADKAKEVIRTLTTPPVQTEVLRQNAFFPVVKGDLPGDLPAAIGLEAKAVAAQQSASNAIVSLPPVGLGSKDGEVSQIFKDTFKAICLDGKAVKATLDAQATKLNAILDEAKVACWKPDPAGSPCRAA
ncbi:MAG: extracellular solute-binding protein [Hamadaea sp.]|uniref:ABC transporter substrate-binding protein n=1 Tax=Hamadaea sp. TaxID=2024425 RepID=UPI0018322671|nr:extracellular solute-binding protein [Hamadaea sp.]NUR73446.1 extracellular solute-binding protein [Hamadaea sp.]NUT24225.1 extracellular solute-binding protein [Hamadaea sp.]